MLSYMYYKLVVGCSFLWFESSSFFCFVFVLLSVLIFSQLLVFDREL